MAVVIHFGPDLTLVKIDHTSRSQILTKVVQGTHHFSSDGLYIQGLVRLNPNKCSKQGVSLREDMFIGID